MKHPRRALSAGLATAIAACSYYDSSLLDAPGFANGSAGKTVAMKGGARTGGASIVVAGAAGAPIAGAAGADDVAGSGGAIASGGGSGGSGGDGGGEGGSPQCQASAHHPPNAPVSDDVAGSGGASDIDFVVSVSQVSFALTDGSPSGFDLDDLCSCIGSDGFGCKVAGGVPPCDKADGIDNASSRLDVLLQTAGVGPDSLNKNLANGGWSLLFRVRGYNGLPNDTKVELDWLAGGAFDSGNGGSGGMDTKPKLDGTDAWPVYSAGFATNPDGTPDESTATARDLSAYVSNGVLVGSLKASGTVLPFSANFVVKLSTVFVTGKLVQRPSDQKWMLTNGDIGGVWDADDLLGQLGHLGITSLNLCTDSSLYKSVKSTICGSVDIATSGVDPTGQVPCDAISFGIAVETVPGAIGAVVPAPTPASDCPPATDPVTDSCEQ